MVQNDMLARQNFDFLAQSLARMNLQGSPVKTDDITGNMNEELRTWIEKRVIFWQQQYKA